MRTILAQAPLDLGRRRRGRRGVLHRSRAGRREFRRDTYLAAILRTTTSVLAEATPVAKELVKVRALGEQLRQAASAELVSRHPRASRPEPSGESPPVLSMSLPAAPHQSSAGSRGTRPALAPQHARTHQSKSRSQFWSEDPPVRAPLHQPLARRASQVPASTPASERDRGGPGRLAARGTLEMELRYRTFICAPVTGGRGRSPAPRAPAAHNLDPRPI